MSEIIGSTYEVVERLGAGGGGVVFLANHLRLNKQVVLKADKRRITTRPELLRREVDVLKDLRHPYIPQVYDFFAEGETVYTVMDFVDGESLDKPLKRNERFSQPQVIAWTKQLLQALDYLHSPIHGTPPRGYVHSDIKPANLMRRYNGDICLIDFNISLALGEENVIGASEGYASPEHYGLDFSFSGATATQTDKTAVIHSDKTLLEDDRTLPLTAAAGRSDSPHKLVVPDVRSDIYSTGATLYHLLSGSRPAKNATEVVPLSGPGISPQVAGIIAKAMNPNPDLRYQTAEEMLWDLEHLYENDPRTKRLKGQRRAAAAVLAALFLAGGLSTFVGLRQMERAQQAARVEAEQAAASEQEAKLALELIQASQSALRAGDTAQAKEKALAALEKKTPYEPMAQRALTSALGVYSLTEGYKAHAAVTLPGEVMKQVLSPSGGYAAVLTSGQVNVVELAAGQVAAQLPASSSAYSDMVFAGEETLIYAGTDGVCAWDLLSGQALWSAGDQAVTLALSGDGSTVAAAHPDGGGAELYDSRSGAPRGSVSFGGLRQRILENNSFADPMDDLFALDSSGRYLAVSFENGGVWIFDTVNPDESVEVLQQSDYVFFEGGFYGGIFAFTAYDGANSDFLAVNAAAAELVGSMSGPGQLRLTVCEDGFCLAESNVLVRLDIETGTQTELAYTQSGIQLFSHTKEGTLVRTPEQKLLFFDSGAVLFDQHDDIPCDFGALSGGYAVLSGRDSPSLRIMKLERCEEQQLASYPGGYFHDEARVSSSRDRVMLFSMDGFRIYDMDGIQLAEVDLPDSEQIYDQQYRRDNGQEYLEVIYYDGTRRIYAAADGALLSQEAGEKPDETLYEEFQTEKYLVTSPLHGAPSVVERASGTAIRELESEDFLTYVTEVEGGVITEYVTAGGERYGLLLNEQWETVADLPGLCDILPDGTLVFDDMRGNLRQSRIYSTQELMALGNTN